MAQDFQRSIEELIGDETNFIANAANFAAFLYENLGDVNWVGFYFSEGNGLVLGPFAGKPACIRIEKGKGVCGTAQQKRETQIVEDVDQFPGHIACDPNSRSEIVVPLIYESKCHGVLDVDSPKPARFSPEDGEMLEKLTDILMRKSDVVKLANYYDVK